MTLSLYTMALEAGLRSCEVILNEAGCSEFRFFVSLIFMDT